MDQIRNFVVIAHIDHGKSTLADRFLEITRTVEARDMKPQLLDQMDIERERGITIKMQPVRMNYALNAVPYILNLIDTPGHIDFSYEVSRALAAVEGAVLLVDATQGVQAQTLTNLHIAEKEGLTIIPVVNKIDASGARVPETVHELAQLLGCSDEHVSRVSAKTGEGVKELLERVIHEIPSPSISEQNSVLKALIFDSIFESHRGVIAYVRVFEGEIKKGQKAFLHAVKTMFEVKDVGVFTPALKSAESLRAGEIGYVVTGIKDPLSVRIGDTIFLALEAQSLSAQALPGYMRPQPVVWASMYPEEENDFEALRDALGKLQLNDSAFRFEPESSPVLGRSFACGFLGMLHLEIVTERIRREFSLSVITTSPSIAYEVKRKNAAPEIVSSAAKFPNTGDIESIAEPWITAEIITPERFLGNILGLVDAHEGTVLASEPLIIGAGVSGTQSDIRMKLRAEMPLREIVSDFFDTLKNVTAGYASFTYEPAGHRSAEVERVDIHVAGEPIAALSRIVSRRKAESGARQFVEQLKEVLPRQLFQIKIQAIVGGRIIASETLSALKKDVTGYLYGGDRTRKMKLWKKQKEGKKRLKAKGRVRIPPDVFLKIMKR
ncbi:MAG: GTP-binding protein LepA [Parcubacteria group bacterium Gr01-1014_70]|nr:MAG: GTP-binding protein LepA [Parcubacteria group bacterium Gr01-1014_70]